MLQILEEQQSPAPPPTNTLRPHPAANLIRRMTDEEFASFKEDIRINGLRVPIQLYKGKILDGRSRYKACLELGFPVRTEEVGKARGFDAKAYVRSLNVERRHLSKDELAELAADEAAQTRGGDRKSGEYQSARLQNGLTQSEAADKYDVSARTVGQVVRIRKAKKNGEHPDIVESYENGEITSGEADKRMRQASTGESGSTESGESNGEWYTPPEFIRAARATMGGIELDPASCAQANKKIVKADRFYTKSQNALEQEWKAGSVWLNPPYEHPLCGQLVDKLLDSPGVGQAIVLTQDSTDTAYWQRLANRSDIFGFTKGRIKFICGKGDKVKFPKPPTTVRPRKCMDNFGVAMFDIDEDPNKLMEGFASSKRGSTVFGIGVDPQEFVENFGSLCDFYKKVHTGDPVRRN